MQETLMSKISSAISSLHQRQVLNCILYSKTYDRVKLVEQIYMMSREFLLAGNEKKALRFYIIGQLLCDKFNL